VFRKIPPLKYYFSDDRKFYKLIFRLTGFYPKNIQVFKVAFTHKSASRFFTKTKNYNNERLEFLGDAILAAVVADFLFSYFPYKKEGFLTKLRARIVSREQLNEIAQNMGLQYHVVSQSKINGTRNIYGNALEALIGAIFIDRGYEKTRSFIIQQLISKNIDLNELSQHDSDYKSQLIEWAQKNKLEIYFDDDEVESTEHSSLYFTSEVRLADKILGKGKGLSKKEAQQNAAKEALNAKELLVDSI